MSSLFQRFSQGKRLVVVAAAELWETKAGGPGFPSGCGKARSVLAERLSKEVVGNLWAGPPVHRFSIASGRHGRSALDNLLLDPYFAEKVQQAQAGWRRVVATAVAMGVPVPALSSALAFYDGYRHDRLPANLLQAQRDYFGAHTYERIDRPRGEYSHTDWTGHGGDITARTYIA